MVELKNINKTFKLAKRNAGLSEAVKALFRKEYSYIQALNDVSFTIKVGEMVGYIGPNSAGKSSTIKIMSGILTPDSGECSINGKTPWKDRIAHVKEIGVVFGQRSQLWWDVPVADSFELLKDIYKVDGTAFKRNLDELTELLDISEIIRTPAMSNNSGEIKIEYQTVKKTDKPISRPETAASQAFTTKYEERCTACCKTIADTFYELLVALSQLARLDLAVKEKCSKDVSKLAENMVERLKEWPPVPTMNMRKVETYAPHERL